MFNDRFRILSLDGGGIRGAFTASALATLEKRTGRRVIDHFDLIAGTSTGGILAIGLALGRSAEEIRDFYVEYGNTIFPSTGVIHRLGLTLQQLVFPKRSRARLEDALGSVFGDRKFGEARCRLVIPTYDAVSGRIYILKTAHLPQFTDEYRARAVDCALATSAAPTYYRASPFPEHQGVSYIDGGVWANCPVMVGLTEAVHFLRVPLDRVDILSIGTVGEPFSVSKARRFGGIAQWNTALIDVLFRGQAEAALAEASLLTGGRVHRINAVVDRGRFAMDDARGVSDLVALGASEARKQANVTMVAERFLNGSSAAPFTPAYNTTS
ncbi:MAG TPA: CBASS cGAMP-activated phospholipase [Gemmatimonadaceae bacterium]|nr:CBASS cGAMP-activated phospholipase [Gemmatimonadaceae bacterium]